MNILLFDSEYRHLNLLPLAYTRPICEFRVGILSIIEKWRRRLPLELISPLAVDYLRVKYPPEIEEDNIFVAGWLLPDDKLIKAVTGLQKGEGFADGDILLAFRGSIDDFEAVKAESLPSAPFELRKIDYVFDIFLLNDAEIKADYRLLTAGRKSLPIPEGTRIFGPLELEDGLPAVFIEEGADVTGASLNTKGGPIYIGVNAEVMEGSCLRGPVAVCENAKVNMLTKIYGATTIGPWCKVGGELNNAVMFGFSNKAHEGFLGNAVVGEWCNIGAGTNASNIKNDYSKIRIWNYATRTFMRTDLQFCGLIMGDHSKAGINCMLNTATVVGVGVNLHGAGFPRTFIPSFTHGSPATGFKEIPLKTHIEIADRMMMRRGRRVTEGDLKILEYARALASELR